MSKSNRPSYVITLRPLPQEDDPNGIRRIRAALKALVRGYRLQPTSIVEAKEDVKPSEKRT
jgi:hypothetical protein